MATHNGHEKKPIIEDLLKNPQQFDFFQAVKLLLTYYPLKHLCFKTHTNLSFPMAAIEKIILKDHLLAIEQNFMGLTGPSGVLPDHFTALVQQRHQQKDEALTDFLNIFEDKIVKLFYQCFEPAINLEAITNIIDALTGEPITLLEQQGFHANCIRYYAALFANSARPAMTLSTMLSDYFQLPITIESFTGQWIKLPIEKLTKLGNHHKLGEKTILGKSLWHGQNCFTLLIGPIKYEQFLQLLPNGAMLKAIQAFTRCYVGMTYEFQTKCIIQSESIPPCRLGQHDTYQLGLTSWLNNKPNPRKNMMIEL